MPQAMQSMMPGRRPFSPLPISNPDLELTSMLGDSAADDIKRALSSSMQTNVDENSIPQSVEVSSTDDMSKFEAIKRTLRKLHKGEE
mgnify:FL=1